MPHGGRWRGEGQTEASICHSVQRIPSSSLSPPPPPAPAPAPAPPWASSEASSQVAGVLVGSRGESRLLHTRKSSSPSVVLGREGIGLRRVRSAPSPRTLQRCRVAAASTTSSATLTLTSAGTSTLTSSATSAVSTAAGGDRWLFASTLSAGWSSDPSTHGCPKVLPSWYCPAPVGSSPLGASSPTVSVSKI